MLSATAFRVFFKSNKKKLCRNVYIVSPVFVNLKIARTHQTTLPAKMNNECK